MPGSQTNAKPVPLPKSFSGLAFKKFLDDGIDRYSLTRARNAAFRKAIGGDLTEGPFATPLRIGIGPAPPLLHRVRLYRQTE